jgi:hypothetical protein
MEVDRAKQAVMMEIDRPHVLRNDLRLPSGGHLCLCLASTAG